MQIAPGILKDMSSAGSNGLTPIKWFPDLIEQDNDINIFEEICETTGELTAGGGAMIMSTVQSGPIERDFGPGDEGTPVSQDSPKITLNLDRSAAFFRLIDDIQDAQSDKSAKWRAAIMAQAAIDIKNDIDEVILQSVGADADVNNTVQIVNGAAVLAGAKSHRYNIGGVGTIGSVNAPLQLTPASMIQWLTNLSSTLGEANVPIGQRWAAVPEWVMNLAMNSDLKSFNVMGGADSILKGNGRVPYPVCNLTLYVNEHLTTTVISGSTCTEVLFGGKGCIMYAGQLKKLENSRPSKSFETILKGLVTYGFHPHRPTRLGVSVVY